MGLSQSSRCIGDKTVRSPTKAQPNQSGRCCLCQWQVVQGPLQGPELPKKGLDGLMGFGDHPDKLNLAGLLNVLDGVVCCPNRSVVRL